MFRLTHPAQVNRPNRSIAFQKKYEMCGSASAMKVVTLLGAKKLCEILY